VLTYYLKEDEKKKETPSPSPENKKEVKSKGSMQDQTGKNEQEQNKVKYDSVSVDVFNDKNEMIRSLKFKAEPGINKITWGLDQKGVRYPQRTAPGRSRGNRQQEPGGYIALPGN